MAVSLVSTGIQFPDSTIQTTAASAGTPVYTLISTFSSTSGTNVIFTGLSSSYRAIIFSFTALKNDYPSTNAGAARQLGFVLSNNNGSSYANTGYLYGNNTANFQGSGQATVLTPFYASARAGSAASGQVILWNPAASGVAATFNYSGSYTYSTAPGYGESQAGVVNGGGGMVVAAGAGLSAVNAINFFWDQNQTFTAGTWKLIGLS